MRRWSNPVLPAVDPPRYLGGYKHTVSGERTPPNSEREFSHEPFAIPLNRPSGTFSPTGGEGWDEGVRFMESLHFILTRIEAMNPMRRVRGPGLQAVGPVPSPGWFLETEKILSPVRAFRALTSELTCGLRKP
jgi:hypothetical protein